MPDAFDVSVIVPTFNRCVLLGSLLDGLAAQESGDTTFEVLIVDNNSTDGTRAAVEGFKAQYPTLSIRYVFAAPQGVSYARNAGAQRARAPILAFVDDDVVPAPSWVASIKRAFDEHPAIDAIGGRIRPVWHEPPPAWFTMSRHGGPIAVQDHPEPMRVNRRNASSCLMTANFACRRDALASVGGFSGAYPRCQDRELQMRLWQAGKEGLYLPDIEVTVQVPADRLTKTYHRRWRTTTGHYHAKMRYVDLVDSAGRLLDEPVRHRTFLGTPWFLYRQTLGHLLGWVRALASGQAADRFFHETRLFYAVSFIRTRLADRRGRRPVGTARSLGSFETSINSDDAAYG